MHACTNHNVAFFVFFIFGPTLPSVPYRTSLGLLGATTTTTIALWRRFDFLLSVHSCFPFLACMMHDAGYLVHDAGWMLDAWCWMLDAGMLDAGTSCMIDA